MVETAKPVKQKKIATVRNPTIEAVVKQLLRLPDEAAALRKMEALKAHFVVSKMQIPNPNMKSLTMWIKGFEVTDAELVEGYHGHFAAIAPKRLPDGKYALAATKMHIDIKLHPTKKYQPVKQRHPNWGHPLLRRIKKEEIFETLEDAASVLVKLHEEYPDASIPGELKLYLMVFAKAPKGEMPIKKWVFEIERMEQGAKITYQENQRQVAGIRRKPVPMVSKDNPIIGQFTAKAALKRKRKI